MNISEETVREMTICPSCGEKKEYGTIMCWDCWKRIKHPFKYSELDLDEWLLAIHRIRRFRKQIEAGRRYFQFGRMSENDIDFVENMIMQGLTIDEAIDALNDKYDEMSNDF